MLFVYTSLNPLVCIFQSEDYTLCREKAVAAFPDNGGNMVWVMDAEHNVFAYISRSTGLEEFA